MVYAPPCCVGLDRSGENAFDHAAGLWANGAVTPGMPVPCPSPNGRERPQPRAAAGDGDRTVLVRAQHGRARLPQPGERTRRGVPVPVPGAHRDDREARPDPLVQFGILMGAAVVRDLEDIDRPQFRMIPQQGLLGARFEVAQQEQGQVRAAHQQGHARVVGALGESAHGRRPQHLPLQRPGPPPLPLHGPDDGDPGGRRGPPYERGLPRRLFQPGDLHHTHRPALQHPCQPAHVVGVDAFFALRMSHETCAGSERRVSPAV